MRKQVHVNTHVIKSNQKTGDREPPIVIRTYKSKEYRNRVVIFGADNEPAAEVIYSPDKPLPCGARVWIEILGGSVDD